MRRIFPARSTRAARPAYARGMPEQSFDPALLQADDEADLPPREAAPAAEPAPDPLANQRPPPWALVPAPHGQGGGGPEWAKGAGFPSGIAVYFALLPVAWMRRCEPGVGTDVTFPMPGDGEARPHRCRQVIYWELSLGDQQAAYKRAMGDVNLATEYLARGMIRAVDGRPVVTGNPVHPDSIERFWADIGPRCRSLLMRQYSILHNFQEAELLTFFAYLLAPRRAAS